MADLQTLINAGLVPDDIETTGPASVACFDQLFGEAEGLDEALKYLLFGPDGCMAAIAECIPTEEPKFPAGAFITSCIYQKVTACWVWDNNQCIVPKNLWPAAYIGDDQPGTIDIVTGAGNGGPEDNAMTIDYTGTLQAQLDEMFDDLAAQLTAMDPYGNTMEFVFLPAPNFRALQICTTDLSQTYGDITIVAPDGNTYVMTPKVRFEQECMVQGFVCTEEGTTEVVWQDYAGNIMEAPSAEVLAEFQGSKCGVPTTALPEVILPEVIPDPVEPGIELTKEDLGAVIQAEDGAPPTPAPVVAVAVKKAVRLIREI